MIEIKEKKSVLILESVKEHLRTKEVVVFTYLKNMYGNQVLNTTNGRELVMALGSHLSVMSGNLTEINKVKEHTLEFIQEFRLLDSMPTRDEELVSFMASGASKRQTMLALKSSHRVITRAMELMELLPPQLEDNIFIDLMFNWIKTTRDSLIWFKDYK